MSYKPTAQEIRKQAKQAERLKAALVGRPVWRFTQERVLNLSNKIERRQQRITELLALDTSNYEGLVWTYRKQLERLKYELSFIKAELS